MKQNKHILFLLLLLQTIVNIGFGQDNVHYRKDDIIHNNEENKWADQVNRLVAPKYVLLNNDRWSFYDEVDLDKDGKNEILVCAIDTTIEDEFYFKIFVFEILNKKLKIIDSSCKIDCNKRCGPFIEGNNDTLEFNETNRHGSVSSKTYKFNKNLKRFELIEINSSERVTKENDENDWYYDETFSVKQQTLTMELYYDNTSSKAISVKKKSIKKIIPKKFSNKLSHFNDNNFYLLEEGKQLNKYFKH